MTTLANTQLFNEVMGLETKSTTFFIEAIKQIAANCNIQFDETKVDIIDLQEKLDMHYANCVNECDTQINAAGALNMPSFTVKAKLHETIEQIKKLRSNPFVHTKIQFRHALDAAYAVEDYLSRLHASDLCDEEELRDIRTASKYQIEFDETDPDFEDMRQKILDCELMADWLKNELIDTDTLNFEQIKDLYDNNDGEYDRVKGRHSSYSRMWG